MARSLEVLERARRVLVGGVNSPVRALVKPYPLVVERARGSRVWSVDGEELIDFIMGYGPLLLGHAHPEVAAAVAEQLEKGWLYAAVTEAEVELAERLVSLYKPGGMARLVNSGTEATMTAIRLARGYTGRDYIVKFDGAYHGAHDAVLVSAGSAAGHLGVPSSPGIPAECASKTLVAEFNNEESVERVFEEHGGDIAAVIVEPVMANIGVIPPRKGFLDFVARTARRHGALVIFDEVVTGFRLHLRGAQEVYGVEADLVTMGKVIGGGFPVGAVVGRREVMRHLAPEGKVFNAGTFNGHPVTVAAGLATVRVAERINAPGIVAERARELEEAVHEALRGVGVEYTVNRAGGVLQFYLGVGRVETAADARRADKAAYARLHEALRRRGILVTPSQLEALFPSTAHTGEDVEAFRRALREAAREALG
ncbi:glutamate-1-semialdehyde 2,1-aminomutase [Stetteria hydrogenophila]